MEDFDFVTESQDNKTTEIEPEKHIPSDQENFSFEDEKYNQRLQSEEENSPLRLYQEQQNEKLKKKAELSEKKRTEILTEANKSIEEFYQKRKEQIQKQYEINKKKEQQTIQERDAILEGHKNNENLWSSVCSLIDFKQAAIGRDTSRLRKLLIELKH